MGGAQQPPWQHTRTAGEDANSPNAQRTSQKLGNQNGSRARQQRFLMVPSWFHAQWSSDPLGRSLEGSELWRGNLKHLCLFRRETSCPDQFPKATSFVNLPITCTSQTTRSLSFFLLLVINYCRMSAKIPFWLRVWCLNCKRSRSFWKAK